MTLTELSLHRDEILWWEICSILHDIGKLSDKFLHYRQNWHTLDDGWRKHDPHDDEWLSKRDKILPDFPILKRFFEKIHPSAIPGAGELSVMNAVHNHISEHPDGVLVKLLKLADGIDSQYDRNNPLFGCEQTDHERADYRPDIYRSNVFGYESEFTRIDRGMLDKARRQLYEELQSLVEPYVDQPRPNSIKPLEEEDYCRIKKTLRRYFRPGLSDTTRPNNDTDLWEHTYSVASITKALHVQTLLGEEAGCSRRKVFRIWGIGFDSLRYLSTSHKIGDLIGRREVLDGIFDSVERLIEYEIPFGNTVYRDDSFLFFVVPALCDIAFADAERMLRREVIKLSLDRSDREIVPSFVAGPPVAGLTRIVEQIHRLRERVAFPVSEGAGELAEAMRKHWTHSSSRNKNVCSVCRVRPTYREEADVLVCRECLSRRQHRTESFDFGDKTPRQTPMIAEIADGNGRAVMIVAKFGLSRWLDGSLVRTNLITEPDAIARTEVACRHIREQPLGDEAMRAAEAIAGRPRNDYGQMLEDFTACLDSRDEKLLFLYARGVVGDPPQLNRDIASAQKTWAYTLEDFGHEHNGTSGLSETERLLGLLCAKTPTPSTILDVWSTTRRFFRGVAGERETFSHEPGGGVFATMPPMLSQEGLRLTARDRAWFRLQHLPAGRPIHRNETLTAHVGGSSYEVVYEGPEGRFWLVNSARCPLRIGDLVALEPEGEERREASPVTETGVKRAAYLPFRCISASPDLLLLIAPADKAIAITEALYESYCAEFGKAYGRLAMSAGHIFFEQHQPMFAVLDAARRMENNFRTLHERVRLPMELPVEAVELNLNLGDRKDDWHHPYVFVAEGEASTLPSFFKTTEGPVARIPELRPGQRIEGHPNYYDAEFLGASAHRFRLHLASRELRMPEEGPLYLEDLIGTTRRMGMQRIWKAICNSGATDAGLRNFEEAVIRREASWQSGGAAEARRAALVLARNLVPVYFPREQASILQALDEHLFFRTLNLYLRILKYRAGDQARAQSQIPGKAGETSAEIAEQPIPAA